MRPLIAIFIILCIAGCSLEVPIENGGDCMATAISVYQNGDQTLPISAPGQTTQTVEFDTELYDDDSEWDTGAYEFTATTTGTYLVAVQGRFDLVFAPPGGGVDDWAVIGVRVNSTYVMEARRTPHDTNAFTISTAKVLRLTAGDVIDAKVTIYSFVSANGVLKAGVEDTFLTITQLE